jgi:hypothetical protein
MSKSQLNKEFSKRDVQRMRNIVTGNTADKTRVQAGYEKENKVYVEGDIWEENGKTWTINNGLKQTITKHDKLRQIIVMPLKCPECEKAIKVNDLNKKMWSIHNKCFNCVVEYETHLRKIGKYEEYEKKLMNDNKDSFVDDYEQAVDAFINDQGESFMSEAGDMENWSKGKINPEVIKALKDNIKQLRELEI